MYKCIDIRIYVYTYLPTVMEIPDPSFRGGTPLPRRVFVQPQRPRTYEHVRRTYKGDVRKVASGGVGGGGVGGDGVACGVGSGNESKFVLHEQHRYHYH